MSEWLTMWMMVPVAASIFSCPKSPCIPMPTRMKPICDIDEQAKVLLRFMLKIPRRAPPNIVMTPRTRIIKPQALSVLKMFRLITRTPNIPDFVRIPESRADAGAGATG